MARTTTSTAKEVETCHSLECHTRHHHHQRRTRLFTAPTQSVQHQDTLPKHHTAAAATATTPTTTSTDVDATTNTISSWTPLQRINLVRYILKHGPYSIPPPPPSSPPSSTAHHPRRHHVNLPPSSTSTSYLSEWTHLVRHALNHQHHPPRTERDLIAALAVQLYKERFEELVREIREGEREVAKAQEEIEEIQRGEWDERLKEEDEEGQETRERTKREWPFGDGNGEDEKHDRGKKRRIQEGEDKEDGDGEQEKDEEGVKTEAIIEVDEKMEIDVEGDAVRHGEMTLDQYVRESPPPVQTQPVQPIQTSPLPPPAPENLCTSDSPSSTLILFPSSSPFSPEPRPRPLSVPLPQPEDEDEYFSVNGGSSGDGAAGRDGGEGGGSSTMSESPPNGTHPTTDDEEGREELTHSHHRRHQEDVSTAITAVGGELSLPAKSPPFHDAPIPQESPSTIMNIPTSIDAESRGEARQGIEQRLTRKEETKEAERKVETVRVVVEVVGETREQEAVGGNGDKEGERGKTWEDAVKLEDGVGHKGGEGKDMDWSREEIYLGKQEPLSEPKHEQEDLEQLRERDGAAECGGVVVKTQSERGGDGSVDEGEDSADIPTPKREGAPATSPHDHHRDEHNHPSIAAPSALVITTEQRLLRQLQPHLPSATPSLPAAPGMTPYFPQSMPAIRADVTAGRVATVEELFKRLFMLFANTRMTREEDFRPTHHPPGDDDGVFALQRLWDKWRSAPYEEADNEEEEDDEDYRPQDVPTGDVLSPPPRDQKDDELLRVPGGGVLRGGEAFGLGRRNEENEDREERWWGRGRGRGTLRGRHQRTGVGDVAREQVSPEAPTGGDHDATPSARIVDHLATTVVKGVSRPSAAVAARDSTTANTAATTAPISSQVSPTFSGSPPSRAPSPSPSSSSSTPTSSSSLSDPLLTSDSDVASALGSDTEGLVTITPPHLPPPPPLGAGLSPSPSSSSSASDEEEEEKERPPPRRRGRPPSVTRGQRGRGRRPLRSRVGLRRTATPPSNAAATTSTASTTAAQTSITNSAASTSASQGTSPRSVASRPGPGRKRGMGVAVGTATTTGTATNSSPTSGLGAGTGRRESASAPVSSYATPLARVGAGGTSPARVVGAATTTAAAGRRAVREGVALQRGEAATASVFYASRDDERGRVAGRSPRTAIPPSTPAPAASPSPVVTHRGLRPGKRRGVGRGHKQPSPPATTTTVATTPRTAERERRLRGSALAASTSSGALGSGSGIGGGVLGATAAGEGGMGVGSGGGRGRERKRGGGRGRGVR